MGQFLPGPIALFYSRGDTGKLSLAGTDFSSLMILRIEKGQRFVPDYERLALAEYFKVSTDYLLGRTK